MAELGLINIPQCVFRCVRGRSGVNKIVNTADTGGREYYDKSCQICTSPTRQKCTFRLAFPPSVIAGGSVVAGGDYYFRSGSRFERKKTAGRGELKEGKPERGLD